MYSVFSLPMVADAMNVLASPTIWAEKFPASNVLPATRVPYCRAGA